jgi:hypothetical protein
MSIDRYDEKPLSDEAREILRLADHFRLNPHLVSERAKQLAADVFARADEIEAERRRKASALNGACRTVPKIWGQWMRHR